MMGAISIVAMVRTANDTFDPDTVAETLIPLFLNGLCPSNKTAAAQARPPSPKRK
jgi:hypothetical protein